MNKKILKTEYSLKKEAEELAIYKEYNKLVSQDGAMPSAVDEHLMKKFDIHSRTTIWSIRKRVERRLQEQ